MLKKCGAGIAVLLLMCSMLHADTIKLMGGTIIQGRVVAETDDVIIIQIEGGSKKISRKDIEEIVKEAMPMVIGKPKDKGPDIREIGEMSMDSAMSDMDKWMKVLEPLHEKQRKRLSKARIDARLERTEAIFAWASKWQKTGFRVMGIDDIDDARFVLECCLDNHDISMLRKGPCRECKGVGFLECSKCRGEGKIVVWKTVKKSGTKKGIYRESVPKKTRCPVCKGKGKVPCKNPFHAAEKRVKKIGGIEKMVEIEVEMVRHNRAFDPMKYSRGYGDVKHLRKIAEQCHRDEYYYIMFEILRQIEKIELEKQKEMQ